MMGMKIISMNSSIKTKLKNVIKKEYSLKDKILLSLLISLTFAFTFFFFGPMDIFVGNHAEIPFYFSEILKICFVVFLPVFFGTSLIVFLIPGKLFSAAVSILLGIVISGYLQANLLNINLGELTGDAISWSKYRNETIINVFAWIICCILPLAVYLFKRKFWKNVVIFCCVIISL